MPAGGELDVHIWRLTDPQSRKVWYEWHCESFLPINSQGQFQAPIAPSAGVSGSRQVSAASTAGGMPQPSPMMDAPSPMPNSAGLGGFGGASQGGAAEGRIKIGQTFLHNSGGRSSYIGL